MSDNNRLENSVEVNGIPTVDVGTLKDLFDANADVLLIDVREQQELDICHVEGAIHIPMAQIPHRLDDIPQDKPVVFMCHTGVRSMNVTAWLHSQDYTNVHNLTGGIHAWSLEIDPDVPMY